MTNSVYDVMLLISHAAPCCHMIVHVQTLYIDINQYLTSEYKLDNVSELPEALDISEYFG